MHYVEQVGISKYFVKHKTESMGRLCNKISTMCQAARNHWFHAKPPQVKYWKNSKIMELRGTISGQCTRESKPSINVTLEIILETCLDTCTRLDEHY